MDIVCVGCGRLMKIDRNSVTAVELIKEDGERYRSFNYDQWKCPGCGHKVLVGHGRAIHNEALMPQFPDVTYW